MAKGEGTVGGDGQSDGGGMHRWRKGVGQKVGITVAGSAAIAGLSGPLESVQSLPERHKVIREAEPTEHTTHKRTEDQAGSEGTDAPKKTRVVRYRADANGTFAAISGQGDHQRPDDGEQGGGDHHEKHHDYHVPDPEYDLERKRTREDDWYQEPPEK